MIDEKIRLTQNQIFRLTDGKKHWSKKTNHIMTLIRSFQIPVTEDQLPWFMDIFIPQEEKRIQREYYNKSQTGEIRSKFTPTDVKGDFPPIQNPIVGMKYHISWAHSGAVFKLIEIKGDTCYVDNPKYGREKQGLPLLKCKTSELRGLRKKKHL